MRIIIEQSKLQFAHEMFKDICKHHKEKIEKSAKCRYEILLKNGDGIKFISTQSNRNDGLNADVAIGPHAEYFTLASKNKKRVWNFVDLENYLENL